MSSVESRRTRTGEVWRVRYRHDGQNKAVTFATERGANDWRALLDAAGPSVALAALEVDDAQGVGTVGELVANHIDHLTGVTEGTRKTYRASLAGDMPTLREIPVPALDRDAVKRWVNAMQERGLSGKSIANRHGLLSAALQSAVEDGIIPTNPCRGVRLPRTDTHEMVFLTRDEFEAICQRLPMHWQSLALTLVGTGMRLGEATALQVRDVDTGARSIRIHQAWKFTGSRQMVLGPPKTRRGKRTIRIPSQVADVLADLMEGRRADALVFTTTRGAPVKQPTFWRHWNKAAKAWSTDPERVPRIHDLRHTFASWAISAGISLPVIQRTLGHESITTTIDRYGHLAAADFDALADATGANLPQLRRQLGQ